MKFSRYNNPNRRRRKALRMTYEEASLRAAEMIYTNRANGIELPMEYYNEYVNKAVGKEILK